LKVMDMANVKVKERLKEEEWVVGDRENPGGGTSSAIGPLVFCSCCSAFDSPARALTTWSRSGVESRARRQREGVATRILSRAWPEAFHHAQVSVA
jgi:hypothetical protein